MAEMVQNIVYSDMEDDVWIVDFVDEKNKLVHLLNPLFGVSLKDSIFENHSISRYAFYKKIANNEKYRQFTLSELRPDIRHLLVLYMWDDMEY